MVKVKMLALLANADGVFDKDKECEVDDKFAKVLIDGGFAVMVGESLVAEEAAEEKPVTKKKGKKVE